MDLIGSSVDRGIFDCRIRKHSHIIILDFFSLCHEKLGPEDIRDSIPDVIVWNYHAKEVRGN